MNYLHNFELKALVIFENTDIVTSNTSIFSSCAEVER